jgi:cysteine desulfurase family protein
MTESRVYYFDHAASSWPKPPTVIKAMVESVEHYGANPGRGSHQLAVKASRTLFDTRVNLARLFGVKNPNDISYASNTTEALNLAIKGFLRQGDHVITTSIEHNSVRRPLEYLKRTKNIQVTYVAADATGQVKAKDVEDAVQANTRMLICNHSSNLLGTVLPVAEFAEICKKRGIRLLVDAAQTAGVYPVDVNRMGIDMLAFPGHKGLLGPQGTGGLYIHPDLAIEPLLHGGTGSQSEAIDQPSVRPDRYEAGTQNTPGIAGLNEGVKFIQSMTVEAIHQKEIRLMDILYEGLSSTKGVRCLGPLPGTVEKTGIVSFVMNGVDPSEMAFVLDQTFQIAVRAGYHCSPLAHETAGTGSVGAVRASLGYSTTEEEVDHLIQAVKEIGRHYNP